MERKEHDKRPTCGEGLAANAVLPAKLSELMAAQAEVLERHTRALDPTDAAAQKELDAYTKLELADLAEEMASYRGLPMGRHNVRILSDPKGQMEAFRRFVAVGARVRGAIANETGSRKRVATVVPCGAYLTRNPRHICAIGSAEVRPNFCPIRGIPKVGPKYLRSQKAWGLVRAYTVRFLSTWSPLYRRRRGLGRGRPTGP